MLGALLNLCRLDLSYNQLTGAKLTCVDSTDSMCASVNRSSSFSCLLGTGIETGSIPVELCGLRMLCELRLNSNRLTGMSAMF